MAVSSCLGDPRRVPESAATPATTNQLSGGSVRRSMIGVGRRPPCHPAARPIALRPTENLARTPWPTHKLLLLPGDGIGPEVMAEVEKVLGWLGDQGSARFELGSRSRRRLRHRCPWRADQRCRHGQGRGGRCRAARRGRRPEVGRRRPTRSAPRRGCCGCARISASSPTCAPPSAMPALADASSLKRELVEGLDILIVRELTGGVYFGEPKQIIDLGNGQKRGIDTQVYDTYEIERIARVAFELARKRGNRVTSSEKRNVMKSGVLWHQTVTALHARDYADVDAEPPARRRARHEARPGAEAVRRHRHRQPLRRHAVGRRRHADGFARHAALGVARRGRCPDGAPQGALRARARLGARHRRAAASPIRSP